MLRLVTPIDGTHTHQAVAWTGFSLATLFVAFRTCVRVRQFHRLFIDDAFILTAWMMVFATTVMWHHFAEAMFINNAVSRGVQLPPIDFVERSETFLKGSAAIICLFYSTLWSVKLSFLFFFRRLYVNVGSWMRYWWVILAITVATWAACIGNIEYKCLISSLNYLVLHCNGERSRRFQRTTLIVNCVLDLFTDVLSEFLKVIHLHLYLLTSLSVTSIPITMLWKIRISMKRKAALGLVFCVTIVTMVFAIVRVSLLSTKSYRQDMTWLYFWSNIESYAGKLLSLVRSTIVCANNSKALIVSSLGSFRSLFKSQDSAAKPTPVNDIHTIGSPPQKRNLHSFAHIFSSSLSKTSTSESTREFVELQDAEVKLPSFSSSSVDRTVDCNPNEFQTVANV